MVTSRVVSAVCVAIAAAGGAVWLYRSRRVKGVYPTKRTPIERKPLERLPKLKNDLLLRAASGI